MEKRVYMSGYHIEWKKGKHNSDKQELVSIDNEKKTEQNEINTVDNITTALDDNITASVDNSILLTTPSSQKDFLIINSVEECDNIILNNGEEIKVKVIEIASDEIKYKKCDNLNGPTYSIKKLEVFMVKYSNGTKDVFTANNSTTNNSNTNNSSDKIKDAKQKKGGGFGIASIVLSLVGVFVAPFIFGPLAIIFGSIGMTNRKLEGLAIAGLIIGIIYLIFLLMIIVVLL